VKLSLVTLTLAGVCALVADAHAESSYGCRTLNVSAVYDPDYARDDEFASIKSSTFQIIDGTEFVIVLRTLNTGEVHPMKLNTEVNNDAKLVASSVNFFGVDTLVLSRATRSDRSATISLQTSSNAVVWRLMCNQSG
jgi:hypothetical protein